MKQFLTTLALCLFLTTGFTQLNNPYPKTISVSGSADMEIVPDEIYAVVTLKEYEKRGTGKIDLEKIKAEFLNNCKNIGLTDSSVTIASYGGTNYEWWRKKKNKDELMASISYQVKFSTSKKMDELVEKLDDDATQSFQVTRVSHSKIKEYRKELKILAIKAAKEKGGYLASAINEGLGDAVTIVEPEEYLTPEYRENNISQLSNTAFLQDAQNGPLMGANFKMIKLRYEVKVVFALK